MARMLAIALATLALAGTAAAHPLTLTARQMDHITAGTFTLYLTTPAVNVASAPASLPAPFGASGLVVGQAPNMSLTINATVHPVVPVFNR